MAIFHGRYSWDGTKADNKEPISWFPGAYDLTITDLSESNDSLTFIRPILCVFTNTGKGYSVSANPEKFAKRICEDFSLQVDKVLWVERKEPGVESFDIIVFKKKGQMGDTTFYTMEKRQPLPNELNIIQRQLGICDGHEDKRSELHG
jgi:hypothetical protein